MLLRVLLQIECLVNKLHQRHLISARLRRFCLYDLINELIDVLIGQLTECLRS